MESFNELEENSVEEQGEERPRVLSEQPTLDVLQALATLQVELSSEYEINHRVYVCFMCKSHEKRKCYVAQKRHHPRHPWLLCQSCCSLGSAAQE